MHSKKISYSQLEKELKSARHELDSMLAVSPITDANFYPEGLSTLYNNRLEWDRRKVFSEALRAWRVNPIARRIVRLMRTFIIGKGVSIKSDDSDIEKFLQSWWNDPLNKLNKNIKRWKDEDTRTGNLFLLCTVGSNGKLYVRAVPSESIEEIKTEKHDIEQETSYVFDENAEIGAKEMPAYTATTDDKFILHFASNQPVGTPWGESDLAPLLVWIGRLSSWLEDRVRLNHFRNAYLMDVTITGKTETQVTNRKAEIMRNPPQSGSVNVHGTEEVWDYKSANLDASDANNDGLSVKKNILSGLGFPMHWFAEPESSTRTTAEAAGTPTFRTLEETQQEFFEWLVELAQVALAVAGKATTAKIWIEAPDITERDNATLALAFSRIYPALAEHYDRDGIPADEFNRLLYRFIAETYDESNKPDIKKKPLTQPNQQTPTTAKAPADDKSDPSDPQEENE